MSSDIPKAIKNSIDSKDLIIFVGAGASIKFLLPSWKQLVKDVIADLGKKEYSSFTDLMDGGIMSPMQVLEFLKKDHHEIRKYIKSNFNVKSNDLSLHKKLIELSGKIITTNYDNAFEKADTTIIPTVQNSIFNISELNKDDDKYIFKIHGSFNDPDTCVIFEEDYQRYYNNDSASIEKLKAIFTDKTILFIGFGFNDPYLNILFNKLNDVFKNNYRHFILTPDSEKFKQYDFLDSIFIESFNEVETYIDKCLIFKNRERLKVDHIVDVTQTSIPVKAKIAILHPYALDVSFEEEYNQIIKQFDNLDIDIYEGYLNFKTIQIIDDFDYLVLITKTYKGKLYIEDDSLKSQLVHFDELYAHIINDEIITIVISNDYHDYNPNLPFINISTFKPSISNKFIFKFLRNNDHLFQEKEILVNKIRANSTTVKKGTSNKKSIYGDRRDLSFGKKTASVIVGRIEEQSVIVNRILKILHSGKILNIKGSGGIGKTTLIKKIVNDLYNRGYFHQGIAFNSCENIKSYDDFEDLLILAFGLTNVVNFKEHLLQNKIKADLLIILDNFESVASLENKDDFLRSLDLLEFCIDFAHIVITSRETIGLEFEDVYTLTPLITDDAMALFLKFYGDVENLEERKILRIEILENLLNNNPLAIKLVTKTRTRFSHISELKEQLDEQFFESLSEDFSVIFKKDVDLNIERTKSIYQSINYSYLKLNITEKLAFEILHLFPDGISLSNFKKCFMSKSTSNKISDKDLRILRDKSLVEDESGNLYLQPIIRRFAEFQFSKRPINIKKNYYFDSYVYNCYILDLIGFIYKKRTFSDALRIHNFYKNNLINTLDNLDLIDFPKNGDIPSKEYQLNYIYSLDTFIINEKQIVAFKNKIIKLKKYFEDLPKANILLDALCFVQTYYHKEFDITHKDLAKILPPDTLDERFFDKEDRIETKAFDLVSGIHSMEGFTIKHITSFVKNNKINVFLDSHLFYLGVPNILSRKKPGFYNFEYNLLDGILMLTH